MEMAKGAQLGFRYLSAYWSDASAKLSIKHEFTQKFRLDFYLES